MAVNVETLEKIERKITLTLPGDPIHELAVSPETPNLVELGAEVISALTQLRTRIAQRCDEVLGPETLFLGQIAAGDFYNRLPTVCRIVGTWRYPPETTRDAVAAELHEVVLSTVEDRPVCVSVDGSQGNEGFRVSLDEPIAQALHAAYHQVTGSPLANGVQLFAADNGKFINWAHVPAVAHGVGLSQAHADIEWCDAADLERLAKVLLATTVEYYS